MDNLEDIKRIVNSLYQFQGQDFKNQDVKFNFASSVHKIIHILKLKYGVVVVPDVFLGQRVAFVGVTFSDDAEIPTYVFERY